MCEDGLYCNEQTWTCQRDGNYIVVQANGESQDNWEQPPEPQSKAHLLILFICFHFISRYCRNVPKDLGHFQWQSAYEVSIF